MPGLLLQISLRGGSHPAVLGRFAGQTVNASLSEWLSGAGLWSLPTCLRATP